MPAYQKTLFVPRPDPVLKGTAPVFYNEASGEVFQNYSDYVQAQLFYTTMHWNCTLSNRRNLTFRQAYESEKAERAQLAHFCEAWRPAALRTIHYFQGPVARLTDTLQSHIKQTLYVGEKVVSQTSKQAFRITDVHDAPRRYVGVLLTGDDGHADDGDGKELVSATTTAAPVSPSATTIEIADGAWERSSKVLYQMHFKRFINYACTKVTAVPVYIVHPHLLAQYGVPDTPPRDMDPVLARRVADAVAKLRETDRQQAEQQARIKAEAEAAATATAVTTAAAIAATATSAAASAPASPPKRGRAAPKTEAADGSTPVKRRRAKAAAPAAATEGEGTPTPPAAKRSRKQPAAATADAVAAPEAKPEPAAPVKEEPAVEVKKDVVKYPIEDLELADRQPPPRRAVDARWDIDLPAEHASAIVPLYAQLFTFSTDFKLSRFTIDDMVSALRDEWRPIDRAGPFCNVLLVEMIGSLLAVICRSYRNEEWKLPAAAAAAPPPSHLPAAPRTESPDDGESDMDEDSKDHPRPAASSDASPRPIDLDALAALTPIERNNLDAWIQWFPGQWADGFDAPPPGTPASHTHPRHSALPHVGRMAAWAVVLVGFLRDALPPAEHERATALLNVLLREPTPADAAAAASAAATSSAASSPRAARHAAVDPNMVAATDEQIAAALDDDDDDHGEAGVAESEPSTGDADADADGDAADPDDDADAGWGRRVSQRQKHLRVVQRRDVQERQSRSRAATAAATAAAAADAGSESDDGGSASTASRHERRAAAESSGRERSTRRALRDQDDHYQTQVGRLSNRVETNFRHLTLDDRIYVLDQLVAKAADAAVIRVGIDAAVDRLRQARFRRKELGRIRKECADELEDFLAALEKEKAADPDAAAAEAAGATTDAGSDAVTPVPARITPSHPVTDDESDAEGSEADSASVTSSTAPAGAASAGATNARSQRVATMRRELLRREEERKRRLAALEQEKRAYRDKRQAQKARALQRKQLEDAYEAANRNVAAADREVRRWSSHIRVKALGRDRYQHRYWWIDGGLDLPTVSVNPRKPPQLLDGREPYYGLGRLLIEAAAPEDVELASDGAGEAADDPFGAASDGVVTASSWMMLTTIDEVEDWMKWLDHRGIRERHLLIALNKMLLDIQQRMQMRHETNARIVTRQAQHIAMPQRPSRSTRTLNGVAAAEVYGPWQAFHQYMNYHASSRE
ncbi:hypothetical protein CXG81DRAFT_18856 [Caulochytrium protostelioides]|uniref:WAC domain-containing protein n=1 Tax=Caulochytrium protostelioides TaxID=1555241 RepID=A0A4P9X7W8_9FUNG|nr:hypothetical protein CXG81DRAFT_18856 [Caulochytrium protostelioides]|eukprot:RKP01328.1 hypothetical protein CXG81DRAFT_18856 [Caulochytrium protostelioides]